MTAVNEKILLLKHRNNLLQGIYHLPEKKNEKKIGILLCNAGLTYNIGVGRLYVRLARALTKSGFHVLRFDPSGTGDSDGLFEKDLIDDLFYDIEQGIFVDDTLAMFDYFFRISPIKSIIIGGFCGGGNTALIAASHKRDKTIGIFTAGLPILDRGLDKQQMSFILPKDLAQYYKKTYLKKILNLQAWKRLFSGKSNFRLLLKVFMFKNHPRNEDNSFEFLSNKIPCVNALMVDSFCQVANKKIPVLFVYGTKDKANSIFKEYFLTTLLSSKGPYKDFYQYEKIENGDHNFSLPIAQQKVIEIIKDWTKKI